MKGRIYNRSRGVRTPEMGEAAVTAQLNEWRETPLRRSKAAGPKSQACDHRFVTNVGIWN
jgi:hypothetical protein